MSYTSLGKNSLVAVGEYLTIRCSPLVSFILLLQQTESLEIQWLGDTLLFSAPITIAAGCRLILSLREATSHHLVAGSNPVTISDFIVQDEPWRGQDTCTVLMPVHSHIEV